MATAGFPIASGVTPDPGQAVVLNGSNELVLSSSATVNTLGIVETANQGDTRANVFLSDECLALVTATGSDLNPGDELMPDGSGGLTNFTAGGGNIACGQFIHVTPTDLDLTTGDTARCKIIFYTVAEQHV